MQAASRTEVKHYIGSESLARRRNFVSVERVDQSLQKVLDWALERMEDAGYGIDSKVTILVDPKLQIMGFARKAGATHQVVIADWALDSEMLGGLILHELSHIYYMDRSAPSHDHRIIEEALSELKEREGLNKREAEYLVDAFNHLQNIIVDDIVFKAMTEKERGLAQKFFAGWVSERRTGDPTADAALLARNAFAVASLTRRGLLADDGDMSARNKMFLSQMGEDKAQKFKSIKEFLEEASAKWNEEEFRTALYGYLDDLLSLMRDDGKLDSLK